MNDRGCRQSFPIPFPNVKQLLGENNRRKVKRQVCEQRKQEKECDKGFANRRNAVPQVKRHSDQMSQRVALFGCSQMSLSLSFCWSWREGGRESVSQ